jgi:hypothetical protein
VVRVQVRDEDEPAVQVDDLALDVLLQDPEHPSAPHPVQITRRTHAMRRKPTSW